MNTKSSDNIYYAIVTFIGVAIYILSFYLSMACLRVAMDNRVEWAKLISFILLCIAFVLPLVYSFYVEAKYMRQRKRNRIWLFILCSILIVLFITYCILNPEILRGHDITMELFLVLEYLILPIVFAVRVKHNE